MTQSKMNLQDTSERGELNQAEEITDTLHYIRRKAEGEMGWTVDLTPISYLWVYKVDGQAVGFLKELPLKPEGKGMIHMIYIHPVHRGKGYGSDMVNRWRQDYDEVWADIREENGREFFSQLDGEFKVVKVYSRWENHPDLDFSDKDRVPNSPYLEHTGETV